MRIIKKQRILWICGVFATIELYRWLSGDFRSASDEVFLAIVSIAISYLITRLDRKAERIQSVLCILAVLELFRWYSQNLINSTSFALFVYIISFFFYYIITEYDKEKKRAKTALEIHELLRRIQQLYTDLDKKPKLENRQFDDFITRMNEIIAASYLILGNLRDISNES